MAAYDATITHGCVESCPISHHRGSPARNGARMQIAAHATGLEDPCYGTFGLSFSRTCISSGSRSSGAPCRTLLHGADPNSLRKQTWSWQIRYYATACFWYGLSRIFFFLALHTTHLGAMAWPAWGRLVVGTAPFLPLWARHLGICGIPGSRTVASGAFITHLVLTLSAPDVVSCGRSLVMCYGATNVREARQALRQRGHDPRHRPQRGWPARVRGGLPGLLCRGGHAPTGLPPNHAGSTRMQRISLGAFCTPFVANV